MRDFGADKCGDDDFVWIFLFAQYENGKYRKLLSQS